ncbi:type IX secretion system protein PorG [Echinicola shivajiensis]|uniref:type IX secretion system protein PorG n=1 Tax=Echinicola shivajiensis TaxID=1035916 RepID=UPI001FEB852B|nr:DUF6089 family protein [Echinicola shivajiensis]
MKKVKFEKLCLVLVLGMLLSFPIVTLQAQQNEYGLGLGVATYSGDIVRKLDPRQLGLQGTFFGRRNFDNVWSLRFGFSVAGLNAADSVSPLDVMAQSRNAYFKGLLVEGHALMEYHFLDYLAPHSTFRFSPYGFFGFGYSFFSGKGQAYQGEIHPDDKGKYSLSTPVIPFGLGVKYKLKERLFLAVEFGFRPTVTDFLDKIEYNENYIPRFPDPNDPPLDLNDPNNYPLPYGINYGNKSDKDWYYFLGVTLSYSFHQVECFNY